MALGGKMDILLAHIINIADVMKHLREMLEAHNGAVKHPGVKVLQEAEWDLAELVKIGTNSKSVIRTAIGKTLTGVAMLLEMDGTPLTLCPQVADVFEAAVPALRELGQPEAAQQAAIAARQIRT